MVHVRGALLAAALSLPCPMLAAQLSARLHLGAITSTPLVRDSILRPLVVDPETALAAAVGVGWQVSPRLTADGEFALTRADVVAREGGTERGLNTVTTVSLTAGATVPLVDRATARIGVGGIRYFPAQETGVFARGGATSVLGVAALAYRWPVSTRLEVGAEVRYDLHTFTTTELEARGFDGARTVHRVGLGLSVAHRWPQ